MLPDLVLECGKIENFKIQCERTNWPLWKHCSKLGKCMLSAATVVHTTTVEIHTVYKVLVNYSIT